MDLRERISVSKLPPAGLGGVSNGPPPLDAARPTVPRRLAKTNTSRLQSLRLLGRIPLDRRPLTPGLGQRRGVVFDRKLFGKRRIRCRQGGAG